MIGAGKQAVGQLEAVCAVRKIARSGFTAATRKARGILYQVPPGWA